MTRSETLTTKENATVSATFVGWGREISDIVLNGWEIAARIEAIRLFLKLKTLLLSERNGKGLMSWGVVKGIGFGRNLVTIRHFWGPKTTV